MIRGAQDWGVQGDMDHDIWGSALPFPDRPTNEYKFTAYVVELQKTLEGTLKEVTNG